jgi:hypothetical protein
LALPDDTRLFICHDYSAERPELAFKSRVIEERNDNIHANSTITKLRTKVQCANNTGTFALFNRSRVTPPRIISPSLEWP